MLFLNPFFRLSNKSGSKVNIGISIDKKIKRYGITWLAARKKIENNKKLQTSPIFIDGS
jgi:hypothetical protein